jgi:hypothetical protein
MGMFARLAMMTLGYITIYQVAGTIEPLDILLVTVGGLLIVSSQHIKD